MKHLWLLLLIPIAAFGGIDHGNSSLKTSEFLLTHDFKLTQPTQVNRDNIQQNLEIGNLNLISQTDQHALDADVWHRSMATMFKTILRNGLRGYVLNSEPNSRTEVFRTAPGRLLVIRGQGNELVKKMNEITLEVTSYEGN